LPAAARTLGVLLALAAPAPAPAQVLVAPGESTETGFRRHIRGHWFAWLAAQEEGDAIVARGKVDEILKYAQKIEIRRITDLAMTATLVGRRQQLQGKPELAREALQSAVRLDPDLPEPRWTRLALSASAHAWGEIPGEVLGAIRASLADGETRRIDRARAMLLATFTLLALAVAVLLILLVRHSGRLLHDLHEVAGRVLPGQAGTLLVAALLFLPLLVSLDVCWFGLFLFVILFGYASWPQKAVASLAVGLLLFFFPVLDRVSYDMAISSSPILRGAEALKEARYDQRVLDNLEAAKNVVPDDVDIRFLLGRLYQALGQNDRAVAEYTAGAQISPRESRCLVNRGNIRFVDGDLGSAQEDYQEALKRDSRNIAARYNLALLYAETFRTVEAARTLQEARALDARLVQRFQDAPTLVKVVSLGYPVEEALEKIQRMGSDPRARRLLGQYRRFDSLAGWAIPIVGGIPLAVVAALLLDRSRKRGRGYSSECQKCGRTFCRLCKPPGESALLCSQCVHVYLKKDGVAIETKLQKLEDVKRRRTMEDRVRVGLNLVLPGAAAFLESRVITGTFALTIFALGLIALFSRHGLAVVPRPDAAPPTFLLIVWAAVALAGWLLGQVGARRT
jgi:tetratricopeptide (TPR) repeat protein